MDPQLPGDRKLRDFSLIQESIAPPILSLNNFEQFFIIGIPSNGLSTDPPQVLVAFPPYKMPEFQHKMIIEHALPKGTERRKVKFGTNTIQEEFVFLLRMRSSSLYGVSVVFSCPRGLLPFFMSGATKNTLYSLCILSRIPNLSTHLSFLTFLAQVTMGLVEPTQIARVESQIPILTGQEIPQMVVTRQVAHNSVFHVPDYFINYLHMYHMCGSGAQPIALSSKIMLFFPPVDDTKAILWCGLDSLFSLLEPKHIIDVLSAIYLDYQVLVIGNCMEEVSMTVLTFAQIIDPMKYCGFVMPMLPQNSQYYDFLQAPTPYIIGTLPCDALLGVNFLESTIIINLDKRAVQIDPDYPQYPNRDAIIDSLKKILSKSSKNSHPFGFPEFYLSTLKHKYSFSPITVDTIMHVISEPFESITSDDIFSYFVTDLDNETSSTVFNKELFLDLMPQEPFFTALLSSQTFEQWISMKLDEFMILKGEEIKKRKRRVTHSEATTRIKRINSKILGL